MATKVESEASRETVYAAIELSKKTWVLGIALPDRDRPGIHRISGGNLGELVARLRVAARAGQPALALVHPEDHRPIKPDPTHHADRLGPQARDLALALSKSEGVVIAKAEFQGAIA
jgi:hypothetical protein